MSSSEQTLITEIHQGLSHGQKGGHGWVHADHLMMLISCGSHSQSLKHAIGGVKWGMWEANSAFKQTELCPRAEREVAGMWCNSGLPEDFLWTSYGPALAPLSNHCGSRAADFIGSVWIQQFLWLPQPLAPVAGNEIVWGDRLWSYLCHSLWGMLLAIWSWAGHTASCTSGLSSAAQLRPWPLQVFNK